MGEMDIVYYDLKTSDLKLKKCKSESKSLKHVEIVEIGAICMTRNKTFHRYILPTCDITRQATNHHGLSKKGKSLYHRNRGEIRFAVTPRKALLDFIKWLKEGPGSTSVLCSYNNRNFDSVILKKNMEFFKIIPSEIEGKKDISIEIGKGFGDAMDILKELKCKDPNIKSTTDMQIPLEYLCEIQIPPNCVRDAISDARYTGLICDEAATRLGYEDFDEFLIDNPQNLFGIN